MLPILLERVLEVAEKSVVEPLEQSGEVEPFPSEPASSCSNSSNVDHRVPGPSSNRSENDWDIRVVLSRRVGLSLAVLPSDAASWSASPSHDCTDAIEPFFRQIWRGRRVPRARPAGTCRSKPTPRRLVASAGTAGALPKLVERVLEVAA